ncbi:Uncharacterized protein conserved in archaea [Pyrobaculum oguniense TE7]|uniref:Uncharacterized protein conserved in archaea n=1 Tax=Pyrobaculum oguniense (strain DSM 13380 / JCM 10595 / TE7) TaxID=698757 RepID=H6Q6K7_PYROT|nr:Uncharacterized protein conserved in archaea [Pyrobaculum oguniense TE7]
MGAESRLEKVAETLRHLGIVAVLQMEKRDPQYRAVCDVVKTHGELAGARLALMNALVSYRLSGKGEEHWLYFGQYFAERDIRDFCWDFLEYIDTSPYLKVGRETRKKRILKVCRYVPDLEDLSATLRQLSQLLSADPEQKTLVFAIKMLNYAYMCSRGVDRLLPFDIPIPVDYRVAHLTWCAGLLELRPEEAMRSYREVQRVWDVVARKSGIPPLHIDTVLWLAGRAVLYGENIHDVPQHIIDLFRWREECRHLSTRR